MSSSDEEWALSDSSSGDESSDDERGQAAAPARKRKAATAKAQGGAVKRLSYRGVRFQDGRWTASLTVSRQHKHLGSLDCEEAAARAFDARAKELRKSPVLNFLPDGSLNPDRMKRASARTLSGRPPLLDPDWPSIYRRVRFLNGRWIAQIAINGQQKNLGLFDSEEAAARVYDARAKVLHKAPILNFLSDGSLNPDRKQRANAAIVSGRRALPDPGRPSIYRGVCFFKGRWTLQIDVQGRL